MVQPRQGGKMAPAFILPPPPADTSDFHLSLQHPEPYYPPLSHILFMRHYFFNNLLDLRGYKSGGRSPDKHGTNLIYGNCL